MADKNQLLEEAAKTGLIEPADLQKLLTASANIKLIDASYPAHPGRPRIGNAAIFDIDDIADPNSQMLHMLPTADIFAEKVGALGIGNDDFIIAYDASGIAMAASRAWWMFKTFGHDNVAVLNGGLPLWQALGLATQQNFIVAPEPKKFTANFRPDWVTSLQDMRRHVDKKDAVILDARDAARFSGMIADPRPGIKSGHMPNAGNLPFQALLDPQTGGLVSQDKIANSLKAFEFSKKDRIITTCGSGVTACVVSLALYRAGYENISVYDGSWTEWASENQKEELATPIVNHLSR